MKPILFESDSTTFTTKGLGTLSDAISCVVTEERNGAYELVMEYPIDGIHAELLTHSRIIFAKPFDGGNNQAFRIYDVTTPINGVLTISAEHISYQLGMIPCGPFTASNVAQALVRLKENAWESCPFTFWTDKSTSANYNQEVPASIRSRLGGTAGSILDVYGGEYEWNNYVVKLHEHRGNDNNVRLNYGKNITDINQEENIASTITGIVPYYKGSDGEETIYLPEHVLYSSHATDFPYHRTEVVDFSSDFDETPTVSQLRAKAQSYITSNNIGIPSVNIEVEFVPLWQTEEYKNIAVLERVKLCDTVHVYFEKLNINVDAKVVKTEYNVLLERYNKIELGQVSKSISGDISKMNTGITNQISEVARKSKSDIQRAVDNATELITGGLGGHVILKQNADGEPEEILIMDTDNTQTAVNVIRMNQNGIGFSTTGYNGPFTTAWTIDGSFVADFITSGTLSAITIDGVDITGSTISGGNGKFIVDINGNVVAENLSVKDVYSEGNASFYATDTANGGIYSNANIYAVGNITSNGNLTTNGGLYAETDIYAQGDITLQGRLLASGSVQGTYGTFSNTLTVSAGGMSVTGDGWVSGNTTIGGDFGVQGTTTVQGFNAGASYFSAQTVVNANFDAYGYATFGSRSSTTNPHRLEVDTINGYLRPYITYSSSSYGFYLGSSTYPFECLWTWTTPVVVSDRNKKTDIEPINDKYVELFKRLIPSQFKMLHNQSGRTHIGFIAQDVEDALDECGIDTKDFAGFCKETRKEAIYDENDECIGYEEKEEMEYSLRYEEFIALNTMMIQKLIKEVEELKEAMRNDT